jgi:hypothetical protein
MAAMAIAAPLLVIVTVFDWLFVPIATFPKFTDDGDIVKGETAIPERLTICGLEGSLSAIVSYTCGRPYQP